MSAEVLGEARTVLDTAHRMLRASHAKMRSARQNTREREREREREIASEWSSYTESEYQSTSKCPKYPNLEYMGFGVGNRF